MGKKRLRQEEKTKKIKINRTCVYRIYAVEKKLYTRENFINKFIEKFVHEIKKSVTPENLLFYFTVKFSSIPV